MMKFIDKNPLVSIITPVYNGANYLREAIESALSQTYKNIEVIVVNDGSNDGGKTEKIAKSYGDKIRYFYKTNGGVASAFNLGIRKMKGEYFSWLSHDDVYYPNKIYIQINFLRNKRRRDIILYSDWDHIDAESKFVDTVKIHHIDSFKYRLALITCCPANGNTILIPKTCFDNVGLFNENLKTSQDYEMWFRLAEKYEFIHIPKVLVKSRIHSEQGMWKIKSFEAENNELHIYFLNKLSVEELLIMSGKKNISSIYTKISFALVRKKLYNASEYARNQSKRFLFEGKIFYIFKNSILNECLILYQYFWKLRMVLRKTILKKVYNKIKNFVG